MGLAAACALLAATSPDDLSGPFLQLLKLAVGLATLFEQTFLLLQNLSFSSVELFYRLVLGRLKQLCLLSYLFINELDRLLLAFDCVLSDPSRRVPQEPRLFLFNLHQVDQLLDTPIMQGAPQVPLQARAAQELHLVASPALL